MSVNSADYSTIPKPKKTHHRRGSTNADLAFALHEATEPPTPDLAKPIRTLEYDDSNHLAVLTQLYGSVWPQVLPYCIATMLLTLAVFFGKHKYNMASLTTDSTGHKFMSMILSFLIVTRARITYARFMEARSYLSTCYRSCRELVHHACVLSATDRSEGATVWRHNVAYRTILMLRVAMATIEYESQKTSPWEIPEMSQSDVTDVQRHLMLSRSRSQGSNASGGTTDALAHGTRTIQEEVFRAPLILMYNLRTEIMLQRSGAYLEKPFRHVNEELKMLDCVTDFGKAFHGLNKLITTPFFFPLVQMTRTFLFVFVFTLPFVLCHDDISTPYEPIGIIFLITFGFLGLEYVCLELADPFGDDPSDFDDLGMAQLVFEDIYIAIYKVDGEEAANVLRRKIVARMKRGPALENFQEDYQDGYNPVADDTILFDRRGFYKELYKDGLRTDLNSPFRRSSNGNSSSSGKIKSKKYSSPFRAAGAAGAGVASKLKSSVKGSVKGAAGMASKLKPGSRKNA